MVREVKTRPALLVSATAHGVDAYLPGCLPAECGYCVQRLIADRAKTGGVGDRDFFLTPWGTVFWFDRSTSDAPRLSGDILTAVEAHPTPRPFMCTTDQTRETPGQEGGVLYKAHYFGIMSCAAAFNRSR